MAYPQFHLKGEASFSSRHQQADDDEDLFVYWILSIFVSWLISSYFWQKAKAIQDNCSGHVEQKPQYLYIFLTTTILLLLVLFYPLLDMTRELFRI